MAKTIQLGSHSGFLLELKPSEHQKNAGLIWGEGKLSVYGLLVIAGEDNRAISWTWVDLLEWLAKNWAYILLEQSFPFQVPAMGISTLVRDLEKRWENMPIDRVEDEEEEACRY